MYQHELAHKNPHPPDFPCNFGPVVPGTKLYTILRKNSLLLTGWWVLALAQDHDVWFCLRYRKAPSRGGASPHCKSIQTTFIALYLSLQEHRTDLQEHGRDLKDLDLLGRWTWICWIADLT